MVAVGENNDQRLVVNGKTFVASTKVKCVVVVKKSRDDLGWVDWGVSKGIGCDRNISKFHVPPSDMRHFKP